MYHYKFFSISNLVPLILLLASIIISYSRLQSKVENLESRIAGTEETIKTNAFATQTEVKEARKDINIMTNELGSLIAVLKAKHYITKKDTIDFNSLARR